MTIMTDTIAANIIVEPTTGDIDLIVEQPVVIVDAPATAPVIVEVVGGKGPKGDKGDPGEDSTVPGPPGPTAVSADEGNTATLGSDSLIYVPLAFDEATADARYVNGAGDTIPGLLLIDRGPGAGIPLLQFRTNNGTQVISSDGSSYMTFSNGIVVPILYTGGLAFNTPGAQIDMNMGTIIQAAKFTTTAAAGHFRNYSDYNASQAVTDQGIIHTYDNRAAGAAPQAAFQAHKAGDPNEQPFLVSSNGYGWLRNLMGNKPVLALRGSPDQTAELLRVEDAAGAAKFTVTPTALTSSVAATFSGYLTAGAAISNAAPTAANHLTRKDYVDARWLNGTTGLWKGTQAQYDAITTKDPNVVYVVV